MHKLWMLYPKPEKKRIISVIDVDSFEVQLWQKLKNNCPGGPLKDHPPTVVADSTKRILAVNPQAKSFGIQRSKNVKVTVQDALDKCPNVQIIYKPDSWGKPSTKEVRDASWNNLVCVKAFLKERDLVDDVVLEYKSGDEIFLDLTSAVEDLEEFEYEYYDDVLDRHPNLFYESAVLCKEMCDFIYQCEESRDGVGWANLQMVCPEEEKPDIITDQAQLMHAGEIMTDLLKFVEDKTGFKASAGISFNKNLAKFACTLHKPESCTIITNDGYDRLVLAGDDSEDEEEDTVRLKIDDVPGIGAGLRDKIQQKFGDKYLELGWMSCIKKDKLIEALGEEDGNKVFAIGRGTYFEPVVPKQMTNQISCGKNNVRISQNSDLKEVIQNLAGEMQERVLEEKIRNRRAGKSLSITFEFNDLDTRRNLKMIWDDKEDVGGITDNIMDRIMASGFIKLEDVQRIALTIKVFDTLSPYTEEEFYKRFPIRNYNIHN